MTAPAELFADWRRMIHAAPDAQKLQTFAAAAHDVVQQVGDALVKPDVVDGLLDIALGFNFFAVGQAEIERIIGAAFDRQRSSNLEGGFERLCREADQRQAKQRQQPAHDLPAGWDDMSIGQLWEMLNDSERRGVAQSTLDAAAYLVSGNNLEHLKAWLLQHSPAEREANVAHIIKRGRS
jgi:hypothetical protein